MAGRPRRRRASSASTAEPIDHSQIRWKKESSVLKPAPRDISDNDWPCYVLKDATVYRKDGKTLANPLLVHLEGPLVVRGILEVAEDEQMHNLVRPNVKSAHIEIPHSDQYSIGDRPLSLWVSGAAGWFEIRPSAQYQAMYDQVREATTLYYSAFDVYEGYNEACQGKKKQRRPPPPRLDDIFLKYAVRAGDGILLHEAKALCDKWAGFLISHFTREVDLDWNPTLFAKSLREAHPDVQKRLADIANGLVPVPLPPPPADMTDSDEPKAAQNRRSRSDRASSRNSEVENNMRHGSALDRSRSPQIKPTNIPRPKTSETPVPLPERYRQLTQPASTKPSPVPVETRKPDPPRDTPMSDADAETPVDRLLGFLQDFASENDIHKATTSKIHYQFFLNFKVRNHSERKDIIAYYAKDLLPRLGPEWMGTPWYVWLTDAAKKPWKPTEPIKPEDIPPQTYRRTKSNKQASSTKPATQLPPALNLPARTRTVAPHESESEEDIAELYAAPQRNRRSGKGASLRPTSSKKRPRSELDNPTNGGHRGRKSAKLNHSLSDEDDLEEEDDDDDTSNEEAAAVGSRLPLPEGAVRVVVHAERMPTTSPSGPDGTWTCEHEGCTYVVRSADEQDAQALIRAHFRDHEAQAEKIDLAVKESRGHMPINHLLSKIQALGKVFKKRDTVDGTPVPAPVKRRLLI